MRETVQIVFMQILEIGTVMEEFVVKADMVVIIDLRIEMVVFIMKENNDNDDM